MKTPHLTTTLKLLLKDLIQEHSLTLFLTISVLIHLVFLLSIPAVSKTQSRPRLFDVDLEKMQINTPHKKTDGSLRQLYASTPQHKFDTIKHEATVSLNDESTIRTKYSPYLEHIRSQINSSWQYPDAAKYHRIEGNLTLCFSIEKSGRLISIDITEPSQHETLNSEALRAINQAAPFYIFPDNFTISKLNVVATFSYHFSSL